MKKRENKEHLWGRNLEFSKFVLLQLNMSPVFDLIAGSKNSIRTFQHVHLLQLYIKNNNNNIIKVIVIINKTNK